MARVATDEPVLVEATHALDGAGFVAEIWDANATVVGLTEDYVRAATHGDLEMDLGLGFPAFSQDVIAARERWPGGPTVKSLEPIWRRALAYLASAGVDLAALRESSAPGLAQLFESLGAHEMPPVWVDRVEIRFGSATISNDLCTFRIDRPDGSFAGLVFLAKPALGGAVLAMLALGDERLFERQLRLALPTRQPTAIMFADLEGSTALSRQLSANDYFRLLRRIMVRVDAQVVDARGIVGKHAGDGITAFFLAEDAGSETAAARAAIEVARSLGAEAATAAERSGLDSGRVVLRVGLHFGASLTVGQLLTAGRADVTAIGDEVNEAARIESCATGGRTLASKALIERLAPADAEALDLGHPSFMSLAELSTATDKAIRDTASLMVCELS